MWWWRADVNQNAVLKQLSLALATALGKPGSYAQLTVGVANGLPIVYGVCRVLCGPTSTADFYIAATGNLKIRCT